MFLEAEHDVTGNNQPIKGSDNRLNVSSRSDGRRYYNSRDLSQTYTLPFDDAACSAGDFNVALFNNRTDGKSMVISVVNVNALAVASFKIHEVTGTAAGGTGLEHIEKMAKKTSAVGQVMVGLLAVNGKDGVGKVVVFVNEYTEP